MSLWQLAAYVEGWRAANDPAYAKALSDGEFDEINAMLSAG